MKVNGKMHWQSISIYGNIFSCERLTSDQYSSSGSSLVVQLADSTLPMLEAWVPSLVTTKTWHSQIINILNNNLSSDKGCSVCFSSLLCSPISHWSLSSVTLSYFTISLEIIFFSFLLYSHLGSSHLTMCLAHCNSILTGLFYITSFLFKHHLQAAIWWILLKY